MIHTQRIGLDPRFAIAGNITAPRGSAIVSVCGINRRIKRYAMPGMNRHTAENGRKPRRGQIKNCPLITQQIPTAITQNIKDLLASREVENIFENSDFVLMLNQAQGDRAILAKQLNISPQQMKYVTHTEAGEGLIFYGNVVLPFVDHFPKDTELYRIMTTKPEEVSSL